MAKAHKFTETFYEGGVPKFEMGKSYPATEETARHAALGRAEEVTVKDVEQDPAPAKAPASKKSN